MTVKILPKIYQNLFRLKERLLASAYVESADGFSASGFIVCEGGHAAKSSCLRHAAVPVAVR